MAASREPRRGGVPAGKIGPGEDRLACAWRELQEETGYRARVGYAGQLHPVVTYSDESIDVWFPRGLTRGRRNLDAGEFLKVIAVEPAQLLEWCRTGVVTDTKTLMGTLWLQNVPAGTWELDRRP